MYIIHSLLLGGLELQKQQGNFKDRDHKGIYIFLFRSKITFRHIVQLQQYAFFFKPTSLKYLREDEAFDIEYQLSRISLEAGAIFNGKTF